MSVSLLPNGQQQFTDNNGAPLALGTVAFYIPGTLTPKDTYQDSAGTILNANPLTLDAAGRATIWGAGYYRQIVQDSLGNTIWDKVTASPDAVSLGRPIGRYSANHTCSVPDEVLFVNASAGVLTITVPPSLSTGSVAVQVTIMRDQADTTSNLILISDGTNTVDYISSAYSAAPAVGTAPYRDVFGDGALIYTRGVG